MAATVAERKLLVDGEWIETGEWQEVRSPFSGDVVGRHPVADAALARKAVDAADRALAEPLPAHRRAAILDAVAHLVAERQEELAQTICAEAGKPLKAARVAHVDALARFMIEG